MKQDKKDTIKGMKEQELNSRLAQISQEIIDLKMNLSLGKLKNVKEISKRRHERAIIKTILTQKQLAPIKQSQPTIN